MMMLRAEETAVPKMRLTARPPNTGSASRIAEPRTTASVVNKIGNARAVPAQ